ncbi:MAG TPA: hypothetical protein VMV18_02315, partial [bacterium]|nr:hypothetical protein [bacterium]
MPPPESGEFPIFQQVLGPPNAPTQAWALRTLGPGDERPVQRLCAMIDEVAWASETIRADARREVAARADGIARARRGLRVGTQPRLLSEDGILAACAFALATDVELHLEPFPPGPVTGVPPSIAGALRLSLTAPMGLGMERPWDAFPLAFVSTPWEDAFAAKPMSEYARVQASIPRGRGATVVLAPGVGGVAMTHLLVSVNLDRNGRPRENYAATFPAGVGDGIRASIAWADAAVLAGAHGGLLHPLTAFVWDNQRRAETWELAGRSHVTVPRRTTEGVTVLDLTRAPTRLETAEGVPFATGVVTWFGAAWARACGEALARFSDCVENVDLGGGCR